MSAVVSAAVLFAGVGISVWLASFIVEAIRPAPKLAATLRWAPTVRNEIVEVAGNRLRFIKTGQGPGLVLHTLRTQLDLFEKVMPELSRHFTSTHWTFQAMAFRTFRRPAATQRSLPRRFRNNKVERQERQEGGERDGHEHGER